MKRNATAVWHGSGREGQGTLTTQSETLKNTPYSFKTRFEEGKGTNPEELVAAAHAGCFTMKLASNIDMAGFHAEKLETNCVVELDNGSVTSSILTVRAKIPNIHKSKLDELVTDAEKNCPISKLLNTTIAVDVLLED